MRPHASILHLDLDAFFAAVEQRDKPSLRGKPVIVGGTGPRGVVAAASYEARRYGVRSAMSSAEARSRCPHAAFLAGRFAVYQQVSAAVMAMLTTVSDVIEPLSLDEAFVDLAAAADFDAHLTVQRAEEIRAMVPQVTDGLTASVGLGTSKFIAKMASEFNKPDGFHAVRPGEEADFLAPHSVAAIPGVGPVTATKLHQFGVQTIADVRTREPKELVRILGEVGGHSLYRLARGIDNRPVVARRDAKSISVEDTFAHDIAGKSELAAIANRQARQVCGRLQNRELSARTITIKYRFGNFETHTKSATLAGPTDDAHTIVHTAQSLLNAVDTTPGLRLLGVGVSGLADWVQHPLFEDDAPPPAAIAEEPESALTQPRRWLPGHDVFHSDYGPGWIWGAGSGKVTVRFETRQSPAGPIHTFDGDDPALSLRDVSATVEM